MRELVETTPASQIFIFDVSELKFLLCNLAVGCAGPAHYGHIDTLAMNNLFATAVETTLNPNTTHSELAEIIHGELVVLFGYCVSIQKAHDIADIFVTEFANMLYGLLGTGVCPQHFTNYRLKGHLLYLEMY